MAWGGFKTKFWILRSLSYFKILRGQVLRTHECFLYLSNSDRHSIMTPSSCGIFKSLKNAYYTLQYQEKILVEFFSDDSLFLGMGLYEILNFSSLDSNWPPKKFLGDSDTIMRTIVVNVQACNKMYACSIKCAHLQ